MLFDASVKAHLWMTGMAARVRDGMRREDGQVAAEYLGLIVVIAVIIGLLTTSELGTKLRNLIGSQIDVIAGGGKKN